MQEAGDEEEDEEDGVGGEGGAVLVEGGLDGAQGEGAVGVGAVGDEVVGEAVRHLGGIVVMRTRKR